MLVAGPPYKEWCTKKAKKNPAQHRISTTQIRAIHFRNCVSAPLTAYIARSPGKLIALYRHLTSSILSAVRSMADKMSVGLSRSRCTLFQGDCIDSGSGCVRIIDASWQVGACDYDAEACVSGSQSPRHPWTLGVHLPETELRLRNALFSRVLEPVAGRAQILLDALAVRVHNPEIMLSIRIVGGLRERKQDL